MTRRWICAKKKCFHHFYAPATKWPGHIDSVTHVCNSELKQLSPLFFSMLWDMDLIFGMWVYNDKLQIKVSFRSNDFWLSYGHWPWTLKFGQIFSCHHFFFAMLGYIDLIFGMRVYNHKLQIKFEICSSWMIFGQLTAIGLWNFAKYLVVTTFFSLWFEILTWFLVCECVVMSYRSSLNFVPIEWFLANLRTLDLTLAK